MTHVHGTEPARQTRLVLPDGTGKTVSGHLSWVPNQRIHRGDVAEWPELAGWMVVTYERRGDTLYVYLDMGEQE